MTTTPVTLLERLRQPGEQAAWERFVRLYLPLLHHWAHRLGRHDQDAADLVQDVFAALVPALPKFRYDPARRFRGWLWTVTLNQHRAQGRRPASAPLAGPEPGLPDVADVISEAEYRQYLTRRALELIQAEFQPTTWQAFWEYVVRDRPAADVGRELGLTENAVYLAKGRVLRYLRRELAGLLD